MVLCYKVVCAAIWLEPLQLILVLRNCVAMDLIFEIIIIIVVVRLLVLGPDR